MALMPNNKKAYSARQSYDRNLTAMQFPSDGSYAHYIVSFGAAVLLTFGRTGFLPYTGAYPPYEYIINVFVVFIVPPFALYRILRDLNVAQVMKYLPFLALVAWVAIRAFSSPKEELPGYTELITCFVAVISGAYIMRGDLPFLRRSLLALCLIFTLLSFIYERSTIMDAIQGNFYGRARLGAGVGPQVFIAFPRVTNTLVIACVACAFIEKNIILRGFSLALIVVPILLGFATAGRGGLLGLAVSALVFVLGLPIVLGMRRKFLIMFGLGFLTALLYIAYRVVMALFPVIVKRFGQADTNRFKIWSDALENISVIGRGTNSEYPHNLFLEFLQDYGVIGLTLLLIFLAVVFWQLLKAWRRRADFELLWVTAVIAMQFTGQQLSLSIFYPFFWTAMMLPLGLNAGGQMPASLRHFRPAIRNGIRRKP
jgi:O-antigen ligase